MKLLFTLILCLVTNAYSQDMLPPNWQRLHEVKSKEVKTYYDANSMSKLEDGISAGIFLISNNQPVIMDIEGRPVPIKSVVRSVIIHCQKRMAAVITEMYFVKDMPGLSDTADAVINYRVSNGDAVQVSTSSVVYKILCSDQV